MGRFDGKEETAASLALQPARRKLKRLNCHSYQQE